MAWAASGYLNKTQRESVSNSTIGLHMGRRSVTDKAKVHLIICLSRGDSMEKMRRAFDL